MARKRAKHKKAKGMLAHLEGVKKTRKASRKEHKKGRKRTKR